MKRKPVNYVAVVICLLLALAVIATLILPVFQIKVTDAIAKGDYVSVTGLDIIKAFFSDGSDFISQTDAIKNLYVVFGRGDYGMLQYVHPINMYIATYLYIASLVLALLLTIFSVINFFGYRLSIANVLTAFLLLVVGISIVVFIVFQNNSAVENVVVTYSIKHYIGEIFIPIGAFFYMMFAPKKRV